MASRAKGPNRKAGGKGRVKGKALMTLPKGAKKRRMGDNSSKAGGVSPEIKLRHTAKLKSELKKVDDIRVDLNQQMGVYRAARKLAKKEGLNLSAFDINLKLEKMDMGQVHQDYADAAELLRLTDSPLATQLSLFQNLLAPEPVVDVALQGLNAGKNAEPIDNCPYKPGTEDYIKWRDNWEIGQQQNREGLSA